MKRTILLVLGALAVSASAFAQAPADAIAKAVQAAPANIRDTVMVVKWKPDFTYDTLRADGGSNMVCYDRSGFPLQQPFSIECTAVANLPRVAQNMKAEATGDRKQSEAMLAAMEKDGTRAKPAFGSVWYHLQGADAEHARSHMTIAVPMATTATLGLPESRTSSGVWIMNAGTSTAHLMVPGE